MLLRTCLAALVIGFPAVALAQPTPPPAPAAADPQWVSLFDGKTLKGWVVEPAAQKGQFSVRDGVVHVTGSPKGGWLRTDRKYGDFTLRYEVRYVSPDHTGNTGLILRSPEISISGRNWPGRGFEMEHRDMNNPRSMLPPEGNILALQPGAPTGRFSFDSEAAQRAYRPTGEWNQVEIIAHGNRMWTRLNGQWLAVAYNVAHPDGHLGFQAEDGEAEYRKLEILEHGPKTVTPDTWVKLFDGRRLAGLAADDPGRAGNAKIADGVLKFSGSGGWLRTERKYTNYVMRLEFRTLTPDADTGVYLRAPGGANDADGWPLGTAEAQIRHQANPPPTLAAGDRRWIGAILRRGGTDGPAVIDNSAVLSAYRGLGEWQEAVVTVEGRNVTVRLNGELIGEGGNVANPEGGYVGLQMGPGQVEFRTIEIKGQDVG
ncbi:DUF1080 domain-containing protein [Phenylobacterium sp. J367]|uniref:3-keto-disaccharide hydrolase n=1 Tax=Phenylobacterium sp. J367 TaxID=2898435 RepID=UPI0021513887|nr:DUF1080 domain-containing protein [Phenylobacterium sp. J367]MCR5879290.1 DUF1080 domain-containing protein [Phenylobacterium sp. J367]